jgi:hypothetical protein
MSIDPMHKAHAAPRCKARSKRTGQPCRAPAVRGWKVCACTVLAAGRLKARGMEIIGTERGRRTRSTPRAPSVCWRSSHVFVENVVAEVITNPKSTSATVRISQPTWD